MELHHFEVELGGCSYEVAALQSNRYTDVPLYTNVSIDHSFKALTG